MKYKRVKATHLGFCYNCAFFGQHEEESCTTYTKRTNTSCFSNRIHTFIFQKTILDLNKQIKIL